METTGKIAAGSSADRRPNGRIKSAGRSRITNGRDVLPNIDGRSALARRYRDIASSILIDQGGADQCSETRQQLIRRYAAAAVLAEEMEAKLARSEVIDVAEHALLCSTLVRIAQRIGLQRHAKDVTPSVSEYLRSKHGAPA